jgi:hypothetical protein
MKNDANHGLYPHRAPEAPALFGEPEPKAPGDDQSSPPLGEGSDGQSPQKHLFKGCGRR